MSARGHIIFFVFSILFFGGGVYIYHAQIPAHWAYLFGASAVGLLFATVALRWTA